MIIMIIIILIMTKCTIRYGYIYMYVEIRLTGADGCLAGAGYILIVSNLMAILRRLSTITKSVGHFIAIIFS